MQEDGYKTSFKNVSYDLREQSLVVPKTPSYQSETPRAKWRRQFWQKITPWAEDRRTYGGTHFYQTTLKPSSRNHVDIASHWTFQDKSRSVTAEYTDPDQIVELIVRLTNHCYDFLCWWLFVCNVDSAHHSGLGTEAWATQFIRLRTIARIQIFWQKSFSNYRRHRVDICLKNVCSRIKFSPARRCLG